MNPVTHNFGARLIASLLLLVLSACSASNSDDPEVGDSSSGAFTIDNLATMTLVEGNVGGINIPVNITRNSDHNKTVELNISGVSDADSRLISMGVTPLPIQPGQNGSSINIRLAIDDLPIMQQQRTFYIDATDGTDTARTTIDVNIEPVDAPDVYLLAGQSNMVGFSGDGTKDASAGGPDEPNPRIYQLNVTANDSNEVFTSGANFTDVQSNVIEAARIIQAEDPLHIPRDPSNQNGKSLAYVGMGMSFAKAALNNTTKNIILVPAAWSGSAFCDNNGGPIGQWNAQDTSDPNLGNTWLFDRAVTRANIALAETGGILRGILWHQGESDSNEFCANQYLANIERLAQQLRMNINADRRGGDFRRPDSNIPFVLGTMSRGIDEREDLSVFNQSKTLVDLAHKTLPSKITHAAITINDDLVPANGYPCGNTTCIHYGAGALREMGRRYYQSLLRAVANP